MAATRTTVATIANGATTSNSIDTSSFDSLQGFVGFVMPAAFTGASISFNVSIDDVTYQQLFASGGSAISITVTAGKTFAFTQDHRSELIPWRYIQLVSASSEGAARTITLLFK
jgi:hypothetical protein